MKGGMLLRESESPASYCTDMSRSEALLRISHNDRSTYGIRPDVYELLPQCLQVGRGSDLRISLENVQHETGGWYLRVH